METTTSSSCLDTSCSQAQKWHLEPPLGASTFQSLVKVKKAKQGFWEEFILPAMITANWVLGEVQNDVLLPGDPKRGEQSSHGQEDPQLRSLMTHPSNDSVIQSILVDSEEETTVKWIARICTLEDPGLERRIRPLSCYGGECQFGTYNPRISLYTMGNSWRSSKGFFQRQMVLQNHPAIKIYLTNGSC